MLANLAMFLVTAERKIRVKCTGEYVRDKIAHITINRAMRIEFIFFICQLVRLIHTMYELMHDTSTYQADWAAVIERSFVTIMLIIASVWDLHSRKLIGKELDLLHPETPPSEL